MKFRNHFHIIFVLSLSIFLVGCDDIKTLFEPFPVAIESTSSEQSDSNSTACTDLDTVVFDSQLSPNKISDTFLLTLISCEVRHFTHGNALILELINGNEISLSRADSAIFFISYRNQGNSAAYPQNNSWWNIALGTADLRSNSINWEGIVENEHGAFIQTPLLRNPIAQ